MGLFDKLRKPKEVIKDLKEAYNTPESAPKKASEKPVIATTKQEEYETDPTESSMPLGKEPYANLPVANIIKHKIIDPNVKQPVLVLINEDRSVTVLENVHSGCMEVKLPDNKTGNIILSPEKLLAIPWGSGQVLAWIASIKEATAYPTDTQHDSEAIYLFVQNIIVNFKNYTDKMKGLSSVVMWLVIGAIVLVAVYGMFIMPGQNQQELAKLALNTTKSAAGIPPEVIV